MDTGPVGSSSHFGAFLHTPGKHWGTLDQGEITPALPELAPLAGCSRSIIVTEAPFSSKDNPQQMPTMPAPTTTMSSLDGELIQQVRG
jgi:hypothetical protein